MILAALAPREEYSTVHIRILPAVGRGAYLAELSVLGWRAFPQAKVRFDRRKLLTLDNNPQKYGEALGKLLFGPKALGPAYAETLAATTGGRRVRLQLDPPELSDIRWERLYHPVDGHWLPLGSTGDCPFSRHVPPQQWGRPEPLTDRPLRVLAVIASPANLAGDFSLDPILPEERQALHKTLDGLRDVSVTYLESDTAARPTLQAIRGQLPWDCDIIHFLCHGAHTETGTVLFLEGDAGQVEPVAASRLVEAVKLARTPPALVFLAACETAAAASHDAFVPLGPALVEPGGVAAVVAMTEQVGMETAALFTEQFYARLFSHGVVDLAVNEARALVQDDHWDWAAPVLFSRLDDNQLIDFPVGNIYTGYLAHSGRAGGLTSKALAAASALADAGQLTDELTNLLKELEKSHRVLADFGKPFRELGHDPATFGPKFDAFYITFKDYYDNETWIGENTSCHKIGQLADTIMPKLQGLLDPTAYQQLGQELGMLSSADLDTIRFFREYANAMNDVVDQIWGQVNQGHMEEAIRLKLAFEAQITPTLRRSNEALGEMGTRIGETSKGVYRVKA